MMIGFRGSMLEPGIGKGCFFHMAPKIWVAQTGKILADLYQLRRQCRHLVRSFDYLPQPWVLATIFHP